MCLLIRLLRHRIEVLVAELVGRLGEANKSERIGGIEELRDDGRRSQGDAGIAFHVHQVAHCVDCVLHAALGERMIPVESGAVKLLKHLLHHRDLVLRQRFTGEWRSGKLGKNYAPKTADYRGSLINSPIELLGIGFVVWKTFTECEIYRVGGGRREKKRARNEQFSVSIKPESLADDKLRRHRNDDGKSIICDVWFPILMAAT